jgi:hypothetical protein
MASVGRSSSLSFFQPPRKIAHDAALVGIFLAHFDYLADARGIWLARHVPVELGVFYGQGSEQRRLVALLYCNLLLVAIHGPPSVARLLD